MNGCVESLFGDERQSLRPRLWARTALPELLPLDRWVQNCCSGTGPGRMKSRCTSVAQQSGIPSRRDAGQFSKSR
jgi:hypothetical protein